MKEQLIIDGIDVFESHGVFILDGGYNGILSAPKLKEVQYNDWSEEDGIEPDLSNPVLDTKEFDITFGTMRSDLTEDFIASLSDSAYHIFEIKKIQSVKKYRLVSQSNKQTIYSSEKFTLRFADDDPIGQHISKKPINRVPQKGFEIDDRPLSNYGVWVLEGVYDQIMKIPPVKQNLTNNYRNIKGATYDDKWVNYQAKDVALKCVLRANSITVFLQNYNALIYDLTRPNERKFYVAMTRDIYPCYYKSCDVTRFEVVKGQVWCEFTLTLVFTDFRPKKTAFVLGSEEDKLIRTETNNNLIFTQNG